MNITKKEIEDFTFSYEDLTLTKDIERTKSISEDGDIFKFLTNKFKYMTKEEQQNLIMKYIDYIEVEKAKDNINIKHVEFRNTFVEELTGLFENKAVEITFNFNDKKHGIVRVPFGIERTQEEAENYVKRLKNYVDVDYYEVSIIDLNDGNGKIICNLDRSSNGILKMFPIKNIENLFGIIMII